MGQIVARADRYLSIGLRLHDEVLNEYRKPSIRQETAARLRRGAPYATQNVMLSTLRYTHSHWRDGMGHSRPENPK